MSSKSFRAFYKGTSLEAPPTSSVQIDTFYSMVVKGAEGHIRDRLEEGMSLNEIGTLIKEHMDAMEAGLCRTQEPSEVWKEGDQYAWLEKAMGKENGSGIVHLVFWFVNIAILLKLKVIESDDMNGWQFIREV